MKFKMTRPKAIIAFVLSIAMIAFAAYVLVFGVAGYGQAKSITLGLDLKGGVSITYQVAKSNGKYSDTGIISGLCGLSGNNNRNKTGKPGLSLHYVECHDNYTLFDKLAMSYLNVSKYSGDLFSTIGSKGLSTVKAQEKLAAAYISFRRVLHPSMVVRNSSAQRKVMKTAMLQATLLTRLILVWQLLMQMFTTFTKV